MKGAAASIQNGASLPLPMHAIISPIQATQNKNHAR